MLFSSTGVVAHGGGFTSVPRTSMFANYNDGTQRLLKHDPQDCGNSSFQFAQGYKSQPIICMPCMGNSQMVRPQSKIKLLQREANFFQDFFLFLGPEKGNPDILERFSERSENLEFREFSENLASLLNTVLIPKHLAITGEISKCVTGFLKGKINGIYTKGLLDREGFYKCLSLPFSDQHAFQSKKKLILLDFMGAAMLDISWRKTWHGRFCRYYFLHVKGHKFRTRAWLPWLRTYPSCLDRSKINKANDRAGLKQYSVNIMGEEQRIRLYCASITGRISRCRFECAVWLAETTFFYGADNTAEQPLNCILTPYHEFDVTASCLF